MEGLALAAAPTLADAAERFDLAATGGDGLLSAQTALRRDGFAVFDHACDPRLLGDCGAALERHYPEYLREGEDEGRFRVSQGRFYADVVIDGPFADPRILANPALDPLLRAALGEDYVFEAFGVIVALPGAEEQAPHRDGGLLFPETGIDRMLPPSALTFVLPLVEMNPLHGSTGFWTGSHRPSDADPGPADCAPVVPVGSAALWDYRVLHKGMENRSTAVRPLVYAVFARRWWIDAGNFAKGRGQKLAVRRAALEGMDAQLRARLMRAVLID